MNNDWKAFLTGAGAEFQAGNLLHFGNPLRECQATLSGLVFADLDHFGVLAVTGPDAADFLQSQLSNDIGECDETTSQLGAYCTPKGRILGLVRMFRQADTFYLRLPIDTLEAVQARLRMYVMRARVTIEDVSDGVFGLGISGADAAGEIRAIADGAPDADNQVLCHDGLAVIRVPGTLPRFEVFIHSLEQAKDCWNSFNVHGAPVASPAWRLLDILSGLPNIYAATSELFVPQMINLQLVNGLSFKKGCYPGQEIVARMQYLGTLKRRMYLGHMDRDEPVSPGDELFPEGSGEQAVGRIVDAALHPDGGQVALAVVQIRAADEPLRLESPQGMPFHLRNLPYAFEDQAPPP